MIANTVIRNVNRNLAQMTRYQDMLPRAAINKPSDDPVRIARIWAIRLHCSKTSSTAQY